MTQPTTQQLAAALKELDVVLKEGEAEFKENPEQFQVLKNLAAELRKLKPGQTPSARTTALLQTFLSRQLDDEVKSQQAMLKAAQHAKGPAIAEVSAAHQAALNALSMAREGVGALGPNTPAAVAAGNAVRMNNANQAAAEALEHAEAAKRLTPDAAKPRK